MSSHSDHTYNFSTVLYKFDGCQYKSAKFRDYSRNSLFSTPTMMIMWAPNTST